VPNCRSFLVTEIERKHVRRHTQFQQHQDVSCHQVFCLQDKAPKKIHVILRETLGEHAPSYATIKNWVTQFKSGDFSTCDAPRPGRLKTVTNPEIIDQIHELMLEDHRISSKPFLSDAEVIAAAETWLDGQLSEFFLSSLQKLEQRAKMCIELRGEYVE